MTFLDTPYRMATCFSLALAALSQNVQAQSAAPADAWQFSVGAAALTRPQYPGSDKQKTRVFPVATAAYGRYAIGALDGAGLPFGASASVAPADHWTVGAAIGGDVEKPRKASDSPRLRGLGDIDPALLGSIFARYDEKWFVVRGDVVADLDERRNGLREAYDPESRRRDSQGTRASLDVEAKVSPVANLTLLAGPGVTWADSRHERTFFGVDAAQSARSGLAVDEPHAGLEAVRMTFGADYRVTPQWDVSASVVVADLQGDAADSPVTARRWQDTGALVATYRF